METYKNLGGDSPVIGYEIGADYVKVLFRGNNTPYRYTTHLGDLARYARQGQGLSTFINQHKKELPFTRG
jgi:hypothetical protein